MRPARRHSATRLASKNKENNQQDVVARNPLPPPASLCDRVLSTPSFLLLVLAIAVALVLVLALALAFVLVFALALALALA